jgi:hypothetical protein
VYAPAAFLGSAGNWDGLRTHLQPYCNAGEEVDGEGGKVEVDGENQSEVASSNSHELIHSCGVV